MKTLVTYASKTGFSKNYATWIANTLACDLKPLATITTSLLSNYDTIIYGGGLYAGGIHGLKKFKRLTSFSDTKNFIVFFTGASPNATVQVALDDISNHNFTLDELKHLKLFYLRGGFNYNDLNLIDKLLMTMLKAKLKSNAKKRKLTADEQGMLASYTQPCDFTKEEKITTLIDYVNSLA